jgi:hypothetical protein
MENSLVVLHLNLFTFPEVVNTHVHHLSKVFGNVKNPYYNQPIPYVFKILL